MSGRNGDPRLVHVSDRVDRPELDKFQRRAEIALAELIPQALGEMAVAPWSSVRTPECLRSSARR